MPPGRRRYGFSLRAAVSAALHEKQIKGPWEQFLLVLPTVPRSVPVICLATLRNEFNSGESIQNWGSGRSRRIGTLGGEAGANKVSQGYRDDAAKRARTTTGGHSARPWVLYV